LSTQADCPCALPGAEPRHAVAVDPEIKRSVQNRLRRIEGQVRGLERMVEEERYCADVITQVSSVQEALRAVSRSLLQNHLRHCAAAAMQSGDPAAQQAMVEELVGLMDRGGR
jgi:DNA-binding FrmR family transcriptional regulator